MNSTPSDYYFNMPNIATAKKVDKKNVMEYCALDSSVHMFDTSY